MYGFPSECEVYGEDEVEVGVRCTAESSDRKSGPIVWKVLYYLKEGRGMVRVFRDGVLYNCETIEQGHWGIRYMGTDYTIPGKEIYKGGREIFNITKHIKYFPVNSINDKD